MTKAELVGEISRKTGLEKKQVMETVETLMDVVSNSLAAGEPVYLRGFGSFIIKQRAAKTARNITKNTTIQLPARKVPAFKPSKTLSVKVDKKNA
ncbi:MAG: integration host factor subunit beta [Bacteroidales bacterium]|uniref:HU family DNA-binding protein n=1 Tax=Porphyromonas sp. TaxID=1924944 RepID=UPI002975181A|nr:HU family DNA-binding protein [Porphyromonas sp.]MDD7438569.1 integration host factor subunit beta [Bacteroidales bacterium]MDY3067984.1 HU family DNA-binding protein [Porphyromonas sp.]